MPVGKNLAGKQGGERVTVLSAGDISFVVTCTILVFLMTLELALFYGGMVRKRNVLSIHDAEL